MCPGNNESAGKRKSGKTRKGNRYLRRCVDRVRLGGGQNRQAFWAAHFEDCRPVSGGKKAAVCVGHKILLIVYHLFNEGTVYDDGSDTIALTGNRRIANLNVRCLR